MGQAIPREQPAVELPTPHWNLRGLVAGGLIAVAGLTAGIVATSSDDGAQEKVAGAKVSLSPNDAAFGMPKAFPDTRYDGGPEEGTRGPISTLEPGTRYDGGPEEGSRGSGR